MNQRERKFEILKVEGSTGTTEADSIAVEEPLEIRIIHGPAENRRTKSLAVTMRTPGNDHELASGFLVSESIVRKPDDINGHRFSGPVPDGSQQANTIEIELDPSVEFEIQKLQRHFYSTSSCGICGKASLDAIRADNIQPIVSEIKVDQKLIYRLPGELRKKQSVFERTGGLHAAGLANLQGEIVASREDVGRHNAVDKLVGSQLLENAFPVHEKILVLSGRASFELMQKALLASIPIVVAVGAPSSLAVELAREFDLTLLGFASENRFNVYSGNQRINLT